MSRVRPIRSGAGALLAPLAAFALLAGCGPAGDAPAPGAAGAGEAAQGAADEPAPEFALRDLEGREVRLSDYRGRAVVVDFWATWCPPCLFQVPELNAFWKKHRDAGDVVVLGVAVDAEGERVVAPWVAEQGVEYPILIGDEGLARRFGVQGFPTLVLVRPDGVLDSRHVGLVELADLERLLAPLRAAAAARI